MNTKIDSLNVSVSNVAFSSGRTRTGQGNDANASASNSATASNDTVSLTGDALQLQDLGKSMSSGPSINQSRVDALRQSIASGSYQVNADSVASKLLQSDSALGKK